MSAGAELLAGPRGTDVRLDDLHRPTREDKREDYADRRAARTAAREDLAAERDGPGRRWTDEPAGTAPTRRRAAD